MIFETTINGIHLQTGDLIATSDGQAGLVAGEFWRFLGMLVPGPMDHIVVYLGPAGRCIEAGPRGVNKFIVPNGVWDAAEMVSQRGPLYDTMYGAIFPLTAQTHTPSQESEIRLAISDFCLSKLGKSYNINYLNAKSTRAYYCSQLAYQAYLPHGIDLNTGLGINELKGAESIIFPQEIWSGFPHIRVPAQYQ